MKRLFLFLVSLTLGLSAVSAQEKVKNAYYIIKDGVFQPGVKVDSTLYCPLEVTSHDGYLSLKKKNLYYQRLRLLIDPSNKPLVLKDMDLVVEYKLPETALCDSTHWMNLYNNRCLKKCMPTMSIVAFSSENYLCSRVYIDGKFDVNTAKDFVTFRHFSYPLYEKQVAGVDIRYMDRWEWQNSADDIVPDSLCIKNLYYVKSAAPRRAIFATQFDGTNSWDEYQNTPGYGGKVQLTSNNDDNYAPEVKLMYMDQNDNWTGSDGSGYLASELIHSLLVKNRALYRWDVKETDTMFFTPIQIPKGVRNLDFECLVRVDRRVKEGAKSEKLPIYIQYDNSKQLVELFNDTIPNIYTEKSVRKIVPAGAKSFKIFFLQAPTASYVVDNLIISTKDPIVATKPKSGPVAGKPVVPKQKK